MKFRFCNISNQYSKNFFFPITLQPAQVSSTQKNHKPGGKSNQKVIRAAGSLTKLLSQKQDLLFEKIMMQHTKNVLQCAIHLSDLKTTFA